MHASAFGQRRRASLTCLMAAWAMWAAPDVLAGDGVPAALISAPPEGGEVSRQLVASGMAPPAARDLWLLVRINDLCWPKGAVSVDKQGRWSLAFTEGGSPPQGRFELVLAHAPLAVAATLTDSLRHGEATGDYPGLKFDGLTGLKVAHARRLRLVPR